MKPLDDREPIVGSVPYLNALPLTWGLPASRTLLLPPPELALALREGRVDAALLSITEALLNPEYGVLDGIGIGSHGPVYSVFLAHRPPLDQIRTVHYDPASLCGAKLLRILLRQRRLQPEWRRLDDYRQAAGQECVLLIGDPAIRFRSERHPHQLWDLGTAWREMTRRPFVFAMWTVRTGGDYTNLIRTLKETRSRGLKNLSTIGQANYPVGDSAVRKRYLTEHIRYQVGAAEKAGIARFAAELQASEGIAARLPKYLN